MFTSNAYAALGYRGKAKRSAQRKDRLLLTAFLLLSSQVTEPSGGLVQPVASCASNATTDEIVVCAPRRERSSYRLPPVEPQREGLPPAKIGLGSSTTLAAEAEKGEVGGIPTNRATIKLRIKF